MEKKTFKVSQIRDLLNQVYNEKITFSRFVEILNEQASVLKDESVEKQSSIDEKQKAKELIESFYRCSKGQTNEARLINAKFSASCCVDVILNIDYSDIE